MQNNHVHKSDSKAEKYTYIYVNVSEYTCRGRVGSYSHSKLEVLFKSSISRIFKV